MAPDQIKGEIQTIMIIAGALGFAEGLRKSSVQFKIGFGLHGAQSRPTFFRAVRLSRPKQSFLGPFILSSGQFQSNKFPVHFHDFCLSLRSVTGETRHRVLASASGFP